MQICSRAGLVALILTLTFAFTSAAPIIKNATPLVSVRAAYDLATHHDASFPAIRHSSKMEAGGLPHSNKLQTQDENTLVRRKVSAKVKHAFQKVGHAIKHVAQKVGHGIKTAAKKVGHFVKTTGAQIAKFGLKLAATAQKVASKVVSFIPGVGKIASKAMEGVSAGLNAASNAIHVKLPKRLQKGVNAKNKVRKISGYVPREFSDFEERDYAGFDLDLREDLYEREWDEWDDY